jgi:hypothetical protein
LERDGLEREGLEREGLEREGLEREGVKGVYSNPAKKPLDSQCHL